MSGIQMMMLCSTGGLVVVPLPSGFSNGSAVAATSSSGTLSFNNFGIINYGGSPTESGGGPPNWYTPTTTGIGGSFWIRATVTTGLLSSGVTGTWIALSTSPSWMKGPATTGASSCTLTFEIASDAAGATIVVTSPGWTIGFDHLG